MTNIIRRALPSLEVVDISKLVDIYVQAEVREEFQEVLFPDSETEFQTPDLSEFKIVTSTQFCYTIMGVFSGKIGTKALSHERVLDALGNVYLTAPQPDSDVEFNSLSVTDFQDHPVYTSAKSKNQTRHVEKMVTVISSLEALNAIKVTSDMGFDSPSQELVADAEAISNDVESRDELMQNQRNVIVERMVKAQSFLNKRVTDKNAKLTPTVFMDSETREFPTEQALLDLKVTGLPYLNIDLSAHRFYMAKYLHVVVNDMQSS